MTDKDITIPKEIWQQLQNAALKQCACETCAIIRKLALAIKYQETEKHKK